MPTSTKKRKSRPPVGRKPKNHKNGGLGGAIARLASNVRPTKKDTRAQAVEHATGPRRRRRWNAHPPT